MSRTLNVVRLQLINRETFVWVPLLIFAGALLLGILLAGMIPVDGVVFIGSSQAPLWYFFAIGISAMSLTFPFSQALSITRREFFVGTMITAVGGAAVLGLLALTIGLIERATDGWGMNGYVFFPPWMWEAGVAVGGLLYFAGALVLFVLGFLGAAIYKGYGTLMITVIAVAVGLVLVGTVFVITRLELWAQVGEILAPIGLGGLTAILLGIAAVLMLVSYAVLRRARP